MDVNDTFGAAVQFCTEFRALDKRLKTEWLRPHARAFETNMERVVSLHYLPLEMMYWLGQIASFNSELPNGSEAERLKWAKEKNILSRLFGPKSSNSKEEWLQTLHPLILYFDAIHLFEQIQNEDSTYIGDGVTALLHTMITTSYGVFEGLASDVWVECVNQSTKLRTRLLERHHQKSIEIATAVGYGSSLGVSVGTIYRDQNKISFNSLKDIQEAFTYLFGDLSAAIFAKHAEILKAEKVRHLIAHKSGIVDTKFKKQMANFPDFGGIPEGSLLPINPLMTCKLVDCCVRTAIDLTSLADSVVNDDA